MKFLKVWFNNCLLQIHFHSPVKVIKQCAWLTCRYGCLTHRRRLSLWLACIKNCSWKFICCNILGKRANSRAKFTNLALTILRTELTKIVISMLKINKYVFKPLWTKWRSVKIFGLNKNKLFLTQNLIKIHTQAFSVEIFWVLNNNFFSFLLLFKI